MALVLGSNTDMSEDVLERAWSVSCSQDALGASLSYRSSQAQHRGTSKCDHIDTCIVSVIIEVSNFLAFNAGDEGDLEIIAVSSFPSLWPKLRRRHIPEVSALSRGAKQAK